MPFVDGSTSTSGITSISLTDGTTTTTPVTSPGGSLGVIAGAGLTSSVSGFNVTLTAGGNLPLRTLTTSDAISVSDYYVIANVNSGAITITLPAVTATDSGQTWVIIDNGQTDAGAGKVITLDASATASTTVNGVATLTLSTARNAVGIVTDGSEFFLF